MWNKHVQLTRMTARTYLELLIHEIWGRGLLQQGLQLVLELLQLMYVLLLLVYMLYGKEEEGV